MPDPRQEWPRPIVISPFGFGNAPRGADPMGQTGTISNRYQPSPQAKALGKVIEILNDPRNSWMGIGMPWLYHGTRARAAKEILEKGFDPAKIGENWSAAFGGLKGRSGPGVYLSEKPEQALGWSYAGGADKPAVVRVFLPEKAILKTADDVTKSQVGRAAILDLAQRQGFKAVKFPNETVIPDPTQIPLRNIRSWPGPSKVDQEEARIFGYGQQ